MEDQLSFFELNDAVMNEWDGDIYAPEGGCDGCLLAYTADCIPYLDWLEMWHQGQSMHGKELTRCLHYDDGKGAYRD